MAGFPAASSSTESIGLSQDAKIGIGISVPLGFSLLVAVGMLIYRNRRIKKNLARQGIAVDFQMAEAEYKPQAEQEYHSKETFYEAPAQNYPLGQPRDVQVERPIFEAP